MEQIMYFTIDVKAKLYIYYIKYGKLIKKISLPYIISIMLPN